MPSPRGLIAVLHLPAMPGDPDPAALSFDALESFVLRDAAAATEGGADALILENFGSVPFAKGGPGERLPPHQVACLALLARRVKGESGLPVGVNCLRNDAISALGIAAAAGLSFVRVNVHSGAMLTDQGLIEGEAHRSLRYRQSLGAGEIAILGDVLVKHAQPLAPTTPEAATADLVHRGLANGVIVTGNATGAPIDVETLRRVATSAGDTPVYLGSGVTPQNAAALLPHCQGAIVGTWIKADGRVSAPIDAERVRTLRDCFSPAS